jgi:Outer membrane protein W
MKKIYFALLAICLSASAHAQHAGDNVAVLGWFHVMPQDSSTPLTTNVAPTPINTPLRLPSSFTSSGTGLSTNTANTVGLVFSHYLTDHIAVSTVAGVPPVFKIYGHGTIKPPGPAGALGQQDLGDPQANPIVKSVRQWSPALLFQYYFNAPTGKVQAVCGHRRVVQLVLRRSAEPELRDLDAEQSRRSAGGGGGQAGADAGVGEGVIVLAAGVQCGSRL